MASDPSNSVEDLIAAEIGSLGPIECGEQAAKYFGHSANYRNLNHGSFGTYPTVSIQPILRHFQERAEARPDPFIRYEYPKRLDEAREAIAKYLHAPVETCVFISNVTIGINTVLRNLVYKSDDIILYFSTIYGSCEKTVSYITESTQAKSRKIKYTYPVSDDFLCDAFEKAVEDVKAKGQNPKVAIFDTIVSLPGVRMPYERLTKLCKQHGVLSCIDAAHGCGHISLNLSELDPDFFVSNCHKWLYTPRGCAVFYIPSRNQALIRSTLPTSHGFVPLPSEDGERINNPLPPTGKSDFVTNFEFVGTLDNSPYLCVEAAIQWRSKIAWGEKKGEDAILCYCGDLARKSGQIVSKILNTEVLENDENSLGRCNFSNVLLPLSFSKDAGGDEAIGLKIGQWIVKILVEEYDTFIAIIFYGKAWWVRFSAQIYLTEKDFVWAGNILMELCERVRRGEWKGVSQDSSKL